MPELRIARDVMEPVVPDSPRLVVDATTPLDQVLDYLAPALYQQPQLPGVAVRDGDRVIGSIPRQTLLKLADKLAVNKSPVELTGVPLSRAHYFVCPKGDNTNCGPHAELVIFYDPDDPPTCPRHKVPLKEED